MRALFAAMTLIVNTVYAAGITDRMSLTEAIEFTRRGGVDIAYSSSLVEPWMRVRETPTNTDALDGLREALAVYDLVLTRGPRGQWLITQGLPNLQARLAESQAVLITPNSQVETSRPIDEIKIVASRYTMYSWDAGTRQFLSGEEIRLLPHIADDVFRAFHRLPGAAANDFSAPFNLRGGMVDEVKVVLDGLELFEPYHMRTLFNPLSIIDPGIIDNVNVLTGGFTANRGNQMSGVIDITSKWATTEPVHELGVSFINAFARSTGAIGDRGSYQVSARRGYLDLLADSVAVDDEEFSPRYSDVFAKAGFAVSDTSNIDAHVLIASDSVKFENLTEREAGDAESSLQYFWVTTDTEVNDRLRWTNLVSKGKVKNLDEGASRNLPAEYIDRFYRREVDVSSLQTSFSLLVGESHLWAFGARYRKLSADYDYRIDSWRQSAFYDDGTPLIIRRDIVTKRKGDEIGIYSSYRYRPAEWSTLEVGLRWDKQSYTDTGDDTQLSPRLNVLFNLSEQTDLRFGWGYFYQPQGIHQLQVEDGIEHYFPASRAEHLVAGIRQVFRSDLELQVDIYQKKYSDLRPRFENVLDSFEYAAESDFDRVRIDPDSAISRGLEITLRDRYSDSFNWWFNYTWSVAEDNIAGIAVPRSWDQRHAFTGSLTWRYRDWVLSVVGRFHSGWPRTPLLLEPILDAGGSIIAIDGDLSQRNQSRYDDYARVDLRLSRSISLEQSTFKFYLELFNVFDTRNECCVAGHDLTIGSTVTASPNYDAFLPFFPSFGFVWTFGPGAGHAN